MPDFPWRLAGCPEFFQHGLVAQSIHCVPEAPMLKLHHLSHGREPDDRRTFPTAVIAFDEIETARGQNEKAAIDQATVAARLFDERRHRIPLTLQRPIAAGGTHRRDSRKLAVLEVEFDGRANIQIAQSISVGETEGLFVLYIGRDAFEPTAG